MPRARREWEDRAGGWEGTAISITPEYAAGGMTRLLPSIGWGLAVGGTLLVGALAAARTTLPERAAATITAFGGGVLLAAVALELVPEADERAGLGLTALGLLAGTVVYVGADAWLSRRESSEAMRRSGHAAAAGQTMMMPSSNGEA